MRDTSASETISVLRHLFASYGLPEQIVSDNGPQFTSSDFADFMKLNGVKHVRSAPYHPSSNGAIERLVQTFKQAMKAGKDDGRSISHRLNNFLLSYRTLPHATTNRTPASLFLGRAVRTRFELLKPNLEKTVCEKQADQVFTHDRRVKERTFILNQHVLVKNFRPGPQWVSGKIVRQLAPLTFTVEVQDGMLWRRHVDHLKAIGDPYKQDLAVSVSNDADVLSYPSTPVPASPVSCPPAPVEITPNVSSPMSSGRRYPDRARKPPDRFS